MTTAPERPVVRALKWIELTLFLTVAMALPWELFQRLPGLTLTVTKSAGLLLVGSAVLRAILERRPPIRRTGVEGPVALFVVAAMATLAYAVDRPAALAQARVYASHLALFYLVAALATNPERARILARAFAVSACGVGVWALACRAGILTPTLVVTTARLGVQATPDTWYALTSRMVTAGDDFNQAVLPLVAAFFLAPFAFGGWGRLGRWATLAAVLAALAGIVISLSRSSLLALAAGGLCVLALRARRREFGGLVVPVLVGLAAMAALVAWLGFEGVIQRFVVSGLATRDASYEGRIEAFRLGLDLLPRYGVFGAGLGGTDALLAQARGGDPAAGETVHSVPFKLWIELGAAGLAAYGWLWLHVFRRLGAAWRHAAGDLRKAHAASFLGLAAGLLVITLIQPLMSLALYPFLAGLAVGPLGRVREADPVYGGRLVRGRAAAGTLAVVAVAGVVAYNTAAYEGTARAVRAYGDVLCAGVEAETGGDWAAAGEAYGAAHGRGEGLRRRRFLDVALRAHDIRHVHERMAVQRAAPDLVGAAALGRGRAEYGRGRFPEAVEWFDAAAARDPDWALPQQLKAEALWAMGQYWRALVCYDWARQREDLPGNEAFARDQARLDAWIAAMEAGPPAPADRLRTAEALRRRARWTEAVDVYREVLQARPDTPEALFNLGVAAEIRGDRRGALEAYTRARAGGHRDAARRLQAFTEAGE